MSQMQDSPELVQDSKDPNARRGMGGSPVAQWEKLLPALFVIVAITFLSVLVMQAFGGPERIRGFVMGAGVWAPAVFILLKASTYVIAPLSGTPLKIAAGALFGVWDGALYAMIGDVLGGSLNFWIARMLGRPGIRRFAGAKAIAHVDNAVAHAGGWKALLVARLVLSGLYDFISYGAGLSSLPYKQYLWVTVVGGVPQALVFALFGGLLMNGFMPVYLLAGSLVILGAYWLLNRPGKPGR